MYKALQPIPINAHLRKSFEKHLNFTQYLVFIYNYYISGCPPRFVRHLSSCYHFSNISDHWVNAEKHCQRLHTKAHLVAIETKEENDFLLTYRAHNEGMYQPPIATVITDRCQMWGAFC